MTNFGYKVYRVLLLLLLLLLLLFIIIIIIIIIIIVIIIISIWYFTRVLVQCLVYWKLYFG